METPDKTQELDTARAKREREQYNEGLKRDTYNKVLSHTRHFYTQRRIEVIKKEMAFAQDKTILELGSTTWYWYVDLYGIKPKTSISINISEEEIKKGDELLDKCSVKPVFALTDAQNLAFADRSLDMVYGAAMLHHLDHIRALDEIRRVLKPEGKMFFIEPLDVNPISKIVRLLTPKARTVDEQPWRLKELREVNERFDCTYYYEEFLCVPFGVLSKLIFKNPDNWLMHAVYKLDRAIDKHLPFMRPLYRQLIVVGTPKA